MFQDIKCHEIRTIRAINYIPKILVSPQSFQKCPPFGKLRKIRRPFSIWTTRNGNLKYHSKLRKIHLIRQRQWRTTRNPRDYR